MALALGGYFTSGSNIFTSSLITVQSWFSSRFAALQDFLTAPRDIASLRQRNSELEAEVAELQAQVIQLQQEVGETDILAALVDFSRANPENQYRAAAAKVIERDLAVEAPERAITRCAPARRCGRSGKNGASSATMPPRV